MNEKIGKNLLILTYWSYDDALIQTYTLPYIRQIKSLLSNDTNITLVTLEKHWANNKSEDYQTIHHELLNEKIKWKPIRYMKPSLKVAIYFTIQLCRLKVYAITHKVEYIHAFCTPAGAFGYFLTKWTKKKLILDSFEPHAVSMVESGTWKKSDLKFKILSYLEDKQLKRADYIIGTTPEIPKYCREIMDFQIRNEKFNFKPACVDLELFRLVSKAEKVKRKLELGLRDIVGVYVGKIGGIYLDIDLFDLIKEAHNFWGEKFTFLMLSSTPKEEVIQYANERRLPVDTIKLKFVDFKNIPYYLGVADFGITPVKPIPSKRYCTPVKNGEYWGMGLPTLITPNISVDSDIIVNEKIGAVFYPGDITSYYQALLKMDEMLEEDYDTLSRRIRSVAKTYRNRDISLSAYRSIYKE